MNHTNVTLGLARFIRSVPAPCRVKTLKIKDNYVGPLALEFLMLNPHKQDILEVMKSIRAGDTSICGARILVNG